jgi:hypothetical protein
MFKSMASHTAFAASVRIQDGSLSVVIHSPEVPQFAIVVVLFRLMKIEELQRLI